MPTMTKPVLLYIMLSLSIIIALALVSLYFIFIPLFPIINQYYFPQSSATYITYHVAIMGHIAFGSVALITGAINVFNALRLKHFGVHKYIGRTYAISVTGASIFAGFMAFHAYAGTLPYERLLVTSGFLTLAICWLVTMFIAIYFIAVKNNIRMHLFFIIINFSLTLAAVTLRLELLPLILSNNGTGTVFDTIYPFYGWLCWLPNVILGYIVAHRLYGNDFATKAQEITTHARSV